MAQPASIEEPGQLRMAATQDFLSDYEPGKVQGRYLIAELPALPFSDGSFELAVSVVLPSRRVRIRQTRPTLER